MDDLSGAPSTEFVDAVKDALDHLYDFSKLNHHPLARWLLPDRLPRGVSAAQTLRQRLIEAISRVTSDNRRPSSARQSRAFRILQLHFVDAMPYREVMQTLALSQAQYH